MNQQQTSQPAVDPTALALSRSIRQQETGGDYTKMGDNGTSAGAYQWNNGKVPLAHGQVPMNFQSDAKELGLDPSDFSQTNQDHVAYEKIKKDLDSGLSQSQIAAKWNSGLTTGWENHKGTVNINGKDVNYDTPAYVANVQKYYQQFSSQPSSNNTATPSTGSAPTSGYNPTPFSNPTAGKFDLTGSTSTDTSKTSAPDDSLGSQLASRVNDISGAVNNVIGGQKTGQSRISGALQIAGGLAGIVGDTVNKGIELIPGVKALEGVIGNKVGELAKTPGGQAIVQSLQKFSTAHPELTKDLGAGFNIVTAIPILKGIGTIGNVALDGVSQALKSTAEKVATKDFIATAGKTVGGRTALKNGGEDAIRTLLQERAIPEIVDNKYTTKEAFDKLGQGISEIENKELQPALKSLSTTGVDTRQPLEGLRKEALSKVGVEFKAGGKVSDAEKEINKIFDDYKRSYGDYVTLEDVNDMKRGIRKNVNFASPKLESDITYHIGQTLQNNIETFAQKAGLPNINAINQKMANLIKAQNMLKYIEGKPVKTGIMGGLIKDAATGIGEAAGNATGIPFAGAYVGRQAGGGIAKKLGGITGSILRRTGKDAVTTTAKTATRKVGGLIGAALAQKATKGN